MATLNKIQLIGHCGRDPKMRYLPSGQAVATISLATASRRKDPNTGERIENVQWHQVSCFGRLAEVVGEYVKKGRQIYIEGYIKYSKYVDRAGVEKNRTEIIATELLLLGGRGESQQQALTSPRQALDSRQETDSDSYNEHHDGTPF